MIQSSTKKQFYWDKFLQGLGRHFYRLVQIVQS